MSVAIRPAHVEDVADIQALINGYAAEDRMLERSRDFLLEHLRDYVVAEDASGFLGCCSLAVLTPDLAEVRSLAVRPEAAGRGIGRQLVLACVAEARRLGLRRVFALTLVPDFFQRCGFVLTSSAAAREERVRVPGMPEALRVRRARNAPASRRDRPRAAGGDRTRGLHAALPRRRAWRKAIAVTRMGKAARLFAASFNTVVMGVLAFNETGGRFAATFAEYVLWGSVLAAAVCAISILAENLAALAWIGIGYILFGGLLTQGSPHIGFVLLALALAPMVPRPRGSLGLGIGIAAVSAVVSRVLIAFAP